MDSPAPPALPAPWFYPMLSAISPKQRVFTRTFHNRALAKVFDQYDLGDWIQRSPSAQAYAVMKTATELELCTPQTLHSTWIDWALSHAFLTDEMHNPPGRQWAWLYRIAWKEYPVEVRVGWLSLLGALVCHQSLPTSAMYHAYDTMRLCVPDFTHEDMPIVFWMSWRKFPLSWQCWLLRQLQDGEASFSFEQTHLIRRTFDQHGHHPWYLLGAHASWAHQLYDGRGLAEQHYDYWDAFFLDDEHDHNFQNRRLSEHFTKAYDSVFLDGTPASLLWAQPVPNMETLRAQRWLFLKKYPHAYVYTTLMQRATPLSYREALSQGLAAQDVIDVAYLRGHGVPGIPTATPSEDIVLLKALFPESVGKEPWRWLYNHRHGTRTKGLTEVPTDLF